MTSGPIERTLRALDQAVHGDFSHLLGDREEEWWDSVRYEVENLAEGVFMEIRFEDFSIWSAWKVVGPDTIDHEGLYLPNDDAPDPFERPDEHLMWPVWRLDVKH